MRFTVLYFLLCFTAFGQYDQRLSLKISPLSFVTPYTGPIAKLSLEHKCRNNVALQYEGGLFFYQSRGGSVRVELKNYLGSGTETAGDYLSLEAFYKYQAYTTDKVVDTADPYEQNYIILDPFDVRKHAESLTVKYGNLRVLKCGFVVDVFCGLGIRFQQTRNSLSPDDNAAMPATSDYGPNLILNKAMNRILPNIVAGIKIGWRLKG